MVFGNQSLRDCSFGPLIEHTAMRRDLARIFTLAAEGSLRVAIGGTYTLDGAAKAHRALAARKTIGKLVIHS